MFQGGGGKQKLVCIFFLKEIAKWSAPNKDKGKEKQHVRRDVTSSHERFSVFSFEILGSYACGYAWLESVNML